MTDNNEGGADVRDDVLALSDEVDLTLHLGLLRAGFHLIGQKLLQNSPQGLSQVKSSQFIHPNIIVYEQLVSIMHRRRSDRISNSN